MPAKPFKPTPPKPFIPTEFSEQVAIFEYAEYASRKDERWNLLFATLNGVRLPIGLAKKCKAAGNKSGVPDMFLPVFRNEPMDNEVNYYSPAYYGLWIELKREKGGVLSPSQKWWHQQLAEMGYRVVVAKGSREAIKAIEEYLK